MPEISEIVIDDGLWDELIELTEGAAALCFQCGVCTATCPWGIVRGEALSVREFMRRAQLGVQDGQPGLWLCTTCAQCEIYCPRGVDIPAVFRGLRAIAWEKRSAEAGLPSLLWSVFWNGNPWSQPPSGRSSWAKNLELPTFDPQEHEILLYIGCTPSYDKRAQKIAQALVHTLMAAGVRFGTLGDNEPCCGESVLSVGNKPYFQEIAAQTAQTLSGSGVTHLVAISPHCYDAFKNHYQPYWDGQEITISHYTQYLAQLVEQGRLHFEQPLEAQITFQDPCYLGRHNDDYQSPRKVLQSIPGVELVEMAQNQEDGLCCGGGGGRMWLETAPGERFADLRVREAADTGASILATACPFCVVCLEDSAKMVKDRHIQVMDIAEVAARCLKPQG